MINITFNGLAQPINTVEELGLALDRFDRVQQFEVWMTAPNGAAMCMLRSGKDAFLMYLRNEGDSGFTSLGNSIQCGIALYTLSNGQVDEYPLSWCIEVENCYKAIAYFYVNEGAKPNWVEWREN